MKDHKLTITKESEQKIIPQMYLNNLDICPICGNIGRTCEDSRIERTKVRHRFFWDVQKLSYHGHCKQCGCEWEESAIVKNSKTRHKASILNILATISTISIFPFIKFTENIEPDGTVFGIIRFGGYMVILLVMVGFITAGAIKLLIKGASYVADNWFGI